MPNRSKRKGNPFKRKGDRYERELVNEALVHGLYADRARGSDGRALGKVKEVDIVIQGMRLQAKRRKKLPKYLALNEGVDGAIFREDNGSTFVLLRWNDLLDKLAKGDW